MADHYDENYEEVVSLPGVDTDGERTENIDDGRIRRPSEFFVRTTGDDIDEQEHARREYFNKVVGEAENEALQTEEGLGPNAESSLLYRIWSRVNHESEEAVAGIVEKKVEYVELFFDLIFVYSLRTINALFHVYEHSFPPMSAIQTFLFLTAVVMQVWMFTTMFFNRYGRKALRDYISIFINMYLLYYMASGSNHHWLDHYIRYHGAWALIMLNLAYRSWDKLRFAPHLDDIDRRILGANVVHHLIECGIILVSIPVHETTGVVLSPLALIYGYVAKASEFRAYKARPCDFPHLAERNLLLVILTFGEMIIGIASFFETGKNVLLNIISFLIVIGMFLSYGFFNDNVLDHHRKTSGLGFLAIHVIMILAINSTTIALELLARPLVPLLPKTMWMTSMLLVYYLCLLATERYAKEHLRTNRFKFTGFVLAILVAYLCLMLLAGHNQLVGAFITLVFVYGIFALLLHIHHSSLRKMKVGGYIS